MSSSTTVKREHVGDGNDDGSSSSSSNASGLPRKLQRVLRDNSEAVPVSPTVAAGVLPRSSVSYASATAPPPPPSQQQQQPPLPSSSSSHTDAAAAAAQLADPVQTLEAIRMRLAHSSDPHLQAKLLLEFSHVAIAPGAPTNAAIDFLFSFLQASQQTQAPSASPPHDAGASPSAISRGGGGPIVVGAIVRGLRKLLAVKASVVEPMIQVDAMGEQLMQCVSVAEDFTLRHDMLAIVVDCLVSTRAFGQVETLLATCVRDHDAAMQALCLAAFVRLCDAGHAVARRTHAQLLDRATALLLDESDAPDVKTWAVRLLAVLSTASLCAQDSECLSAPLMAFIPHRSRTDDDDAHTALPLQDAVFYVLCLAASDASPVVRAQVAQSLRLLAAASAHVVEHALQKAPISEELEDDARAMRMQSVRMLSSGALLDLLEDARDDVAAEASTTVRRFATTGRLSEAIIDRAIAAHVDLLPSAAVAAAAGGATRRFHALVETLERLLVQRKQQFHAAFSLTSEEVSFLLREGDTRAPVAPSLAVLSALAHCDLSSVWIVQRIVTRALRLADAIDASRDVDDSAHWTQQLVALARRVARECSSVLRLDHALVEALETAAASRSPSARAHVASLLLGKQPRGSRVDRECRSVLTLFELASKPQSSAGPSDKDAAPRRSDWRALLAAAPTRPTDVRSAHNALLGYLDSAACASTSSSCTDALRLVAHVLALKQLLRDVEPRSHSLATALAPSCSDVLALASSLYVRERAWNAASRVDLLQLVLLARVGIELGRLEAPSARATDVSPTLKWLAAQAQQLAFLSHERPSSSCALWLSDAVVTGSAMHTLGDLTRAFVDSVARAWPRALVEALDDMECRSSQTASAAIIEPESSSSGGSREPREIVAQWPFAVRVRASVTHVRDLTRLYIKSVLPNGATAYHHVPLSDVTLHTATRCSLDHTLSLTIPPFSDPTSYALAVCLAHPALPGALAMPHAPPTRSGHEAPVQYTEISDTVRPRVFHRTNSTIRRG